VFPEGWFVKFGWIFWEDEAAKVVMRTLLFCFRDEVRILRSEKP